MTTKQTRPNKCPDCKAGVMMVQYAPSDKYHYDGVSEYECKKQCGWRIGRWCGARLIGAEVEPAFCEGRANGHPRVYNLQD